MVAEQLQAWGQSKPKPRTGRTYVGTTHYEGDGVRVNTGPFEGRSELEVRTSSTGVFSAQEGQVYENQFISGEIIINQPNVIVRNCYIDGRGSTYAIRQLSGGTNLLIENCEIYNARSSVLFLRTSATVRGCHLHSARGDTIKPAGDVLIEGNYIEKVGSAPGAHGDGIQWTSGSNCLIRWNNFDIPHPNFTSEPDPNSRFANSQCIIGGTQSGTLRDITVTQNWMNGGGFSLNIGGTPDAGPNIVVTENLFGRELAFQPITGESSNWVACNRWEDTLEFVGGQDSTEGCSDIGSATVADVVFSPDPNDGEVASPLSVSLSSPSGGASIRYTLDGTEPSNSVGIEYVAGTSFNLLSGQTLKAIAYQEGLNSSRVTTADYTFVGAVTDPIITPEAGSYLQKPTITIGSTVEEGTTFYYTFDESVPDSSNVSTDPNSGTQLYTGPFQWPDEFSPTVNVHAIAVKNGETSTVVSALYNVASITSSGGTFFPVETPDVYTGQFHFSCDVTPDSSQTNTLVGFSSDPPADWFTEIAVSVRFFTNNRVEAYNGSNFYQAVEDVPYTAGQTYKLGIVVDLVNRNYDAFISGGDIAGVKRIADDYEFRPTQAGITSISNLILWTDNGFSTTHDNFLFDSGNPTTPSVPALPAPSGN